MSTRWVAYEANGPRLAVLPDELEFSATTPADAIEDPGAATLSYSTLSRGGQHLSRSLAQGLELALEVWTGSTWFEPDGARFIALSGEPDIVDPAAVRRLTGVGYGWITRKIVHLAPSEDLYETEGAHEGRRVFRGQTVGQILTTLLNEYAARGGAAIAKSFSAATMTGGAAWSPLEEFAVSRGEPLDLILGRLAAEDELAVWWGGRTMNAAKARPAPDYSSSIVIDRRQVLAAPASESLAELVTSVTTHGAEGLQVSSTGTPTPWGHWESYEADSQVLTTATADKRNARVLRDRGRLRGEYVRDLSPEVPHVLGWSVPAGCWITAPTHVPRERVKVAALLWRRDSEGLTRSLILHDKMRDASLRKMVKDRAQQQKTDEVVRRVPAYDGRIRRAESEARAAREHAELNGGRLADHDAELDDLGQQVSDLRDRQALCNITAVKHGAVTTIPRPAGFDLVIWIGPAVPADLRYGDIHIDPTGGAE